MKQKPEVAEKIGHTRERKLSFMKSNKRPQSFDDDYGNNYFADL